LALFDGIAAAICGAGGEVELVGAIETPGGRAGTGVGPPGDSAAAICGAGEEVELDGAIETPGGRTGAGTAPPGGGTAGEGAGRDGGGGTAGEGAGGDGAMYGATACGVDRCFPAFSSSFFTADSLLLRSSVTSRDSARFRTTWGVMSMTSSVRSVVSCVDSKKRPTAGRSIR
jgi:hypothetical protein